MYTARFRLSGTCDLTFQQLEQDVADSIRESWAFMAFSKCEGKKNEAQEGSDGITCNKMIITISVRK